jgi:hypothetical protein
MAEEQPDSERPPTVPKAKPPEYPHPGGGPRLTILGRWLKRWSSNAVSRRRFWLVSGGVAIVVIVPVVTAIFAALALTSNANSADRLAAAGDVLVGATLLLGVAAALVALRAYVVTTGVPSFRFQLAFECSEPNNPVFQADETGNNIFQTRQFKQLSGRIAIWNHTFYSAREPRIIVRLNAMAFTPESDHRFLADWTVLDFIDTVGITAIEWEGGPGYSIHLNSVRRLPGFYLSNLRWERGWGEEPGFIIEISVDNFRQVVYLPVGFEVSRKLHALKEKDRGTLAQWHPSPPKKRKSRPWRSSLDPSAYAPFPDHERECQECQEWPASTGADG